ncbi:MAG TPA: hypothetical protein VKR52_18915 [Terracidiphilus sp.]|nr:hypothetical protein [Terracidiphilus sp.]
MADTADPKGTAELLSCSRRNVEQGRQLMADLDELTRESAQRIEDGRELMQHSKELEGVDGIVPGAK